MASTDEAPIDGVSTEDGVLLRRLKRWYQADSEHSEKWRKEAEEDYAFVAGDQWDPKDVASLKEQLRPVITFNRIDPLIRFVSGEQINNAQEVRYLPRELGDVKANEFLTSVAQWFRDQCDADDEESDAFWDNATCGMGWTETLVDVDTDPDEPMPIIDRIDPLEMIWDKDARKRNLTDAKRLWRVREMSREAAREKFPDVARTDLDAGWARLDGTEGRPSKDDRDIDYSDDHDNGSDDDDDLVTIVHAQWWETESYYRVAVPPELASNLEGVKPDGTMDVDADQYDGIRSRLEALAGSSMVSVKLNRKVYKQAFIGRTFLKPVGLAPCPDHFSFQCITGFRDRNKGTFYGLVRAMKDPQRWANKWLSQTMHIMNANAKGGVVMEDGAVDDPREFEKSYARPEAITWVPPGTLSGQNPKMIPKPVAQFPAGFFQLMQFAITSVPHVVGINQEMMGTREADQPASLEYQRRQAGVTILAQLFRSMGRYHRNQGRVLLYIIQHRLSPQQLVQIIGENGEKQYQPLAVVQAIKGANAKYDVVVDEGPTSPNQKERVWALVGEKFFTLPPPIQLALLKYSPFPESVVEEVKKAADEASKSPMAQMQEKMLQLEGALKQVEVQLKGAQTEKTQAETQKIASEIGMPPDGAGGGPQIDQAKIAAAGMKAQTDQAKMASEAELRTAEIMADVMTKREKVASDLQTNREWMASDLERAEADRQNKRDVAEQKMVVDSLTKLAMPKPKPQMTTGRGRRPQQ